MKGSKRLLSGLCALALCAGLTTTALAATPDYSDVPANAWYYNDVMTVSEKGWMTGAPGGAFVPDGYVSRATVLAVLWRLEGSPAATTVAPFPDIPEKNWAFSAAVWAKEVGIATGYSDGTFAPNDVVTREQLAMFLYRYAIYKGQDIAEGVVDLYPDAEYIHSWALTGMKHALGAGLMTGTSNGLSPLGLATRAELAKILVRLTTPVQG